MHHWRLVSGRTAVLAPPPGPPHLSLWALPDRTPSRILRQAQGVQALWMKRMAGSPVAARQLQLPRFHALYPYQRESEICVSQPRFGK